MVTLGKTRLAMVMPGESGSISWSSLVKGIQNSAIRLTSLAIRLTSRGCRITSADRIFVALRCRQQGEVNLLRAKYSAVFRFIRTRKQRKCKKESEERGCRILSVQPRYSGFVDLIVWRRWKRVNDHLFTRSENQEKEKKLSSLCGDIKISSVPDDLLTNRVETRDLYALGFSIPMLPFFLPQYLHSFQHSEWNGTMILCIRRSWFSFFKKRRTFGFLTSVTASHSG